MDRTSRRLVTAALGGILVATLIAAPLAAFTWFQANPSLSELRATLQDNVDVDDEASARLSTMVTVGAAIDLVVNVALAVAPAALVGGLLGLLVGRAWNRRAPAGVPDARKDAP